jgi:hypothetical protein
MTAAIATAAAHATPSEILAATSTGRSLPRAMLVGGTFTSVDGVVAMIEAIRAAGSTEDILGIAIPLDADPTTEEGLLSLARPRPRKGFNLGRWLLTVLDPHHPVPDVVTLQKGRNSILAQAILGNISRWLVGVKPIRVPGAAGSDPGTWILARPNHAAAVAGQEGAALGGRTGALVSLGVPSDLIDDYAARLAAGESLVTTCETDRGRAERDIRLLKKCGAGVVFGPTPVVSPSRQQA